MAVGNSLNDSMDLAVKRYSSLFKLPSYKRVIVLSALLCVSGGLLSAVSISPTVEGVARGLVVGCSLFIASLSCDYLIKALILRADPIYDQRRIIALSFYCWLFWLFFIFIGATTSLFLGTLWWIRLCLLGFSTVLILRLVVLNSTSSKSFGRLIAASFVQPLACVVPFLLLSIGTNYPVAANTLLFLALASIIGVGSSLLFLSLINRLGKQELGASSLSLFKAFLLNWIVGMNNPFEQLLEEFGEDQDVEVSLIKFASSKPKAAIVIPSIHPGPFKNIGSSMLPYQIKTELGKELGCDVCVPHGLLGHELDLASQRQNRAIVKSILESASFEASESLASPFIKVSDGIATACCQVFGQFAFLSLTLAPRTTEDFPRELGVFVRDEAQKRGLSCCAVVNAHNSIDGFPDTQEALSSLRNVAAECLKKAISVERLPFEVGAATVVPKEFSIRDGMGLGGITATVIKVGRRKIAYVVIDGNNMVSGLREKILSKLRNMQFDDGEVLTTDTHMVNALVLTDRGYCPVGEAMNHDRLMYYIEQATALALSRLEKVKANCSTITITKVRVIGEKRLESLCLLVDRAMRRARQVVVPIFGGSGLILILFLAFL